MKRINTGGLHRLACSLLVIFLVSSVSGCSTGQTYRNDLSALTLSFLAGDVLFLEDLKSKGSDLEKNVLISIAHKVVILSHHDPDLSAMSLRDLRTLCTLFVENPLAKIDGTAYTGFESAAIEYLNEIGPAVQRQFELRSSGAQECR